MLRAVRFLLRPLIARVRVEPTEVAAELRVHLRPFQLPLYRVGVGLFKREQASFELSDLLSEGSKLGLPGASQAEKTPQAGD